MQDPEAPRPPPAAQLALTDTGRSTLCGSPPGPGSCAAARQRRATLCWAGRRRTRPGLRRRGSSVQARGDVSFAAAAGSGGEWVPLRNLPTRPASERLARTCGGSHAQGGQQERQLAARPHLHATKLCSVQRDVQRRRLGGELPTEQTGGQKRLAAAPLLPPPPSVWPFARAASTPSQRRGMSSRRFQQREASASNQRAQSRGSGSAEGSSLGKERRQPLAAADRVQRRSVHRVGGGSAARRRLTAAAGA